MHWLLLIALVWLALTVLITVVWAYQTAHRLDRLHVRYDLSWQALDGALARRAVVPPIIVAVAGITPLVPGLAVYRGLSEIMAGQTVAAISNLFTAVMVGCTLAAGVTLGEWVARTLRRPRLPRRLLGSRVA